MESLKTFSSDAYGMGTPEELMYLVDKYTEKMRELTKNFVDDCIENNIEYLSAYGAMFSWMMQELTMHYCKKYSDDKKAK